MAGLLLAAGAGRRMGKPKALIRGESGEAWVVRGARVLLDSGCSPVVVMIGAAAEEVRGLLDQAFADELRLVVHEAAEWRGGMGASLRSGIARLAELAGSAEPAGWAGTAEARAGAGIVGALITLVDTPSLRVETVDRVCSVAIGDRGAGLGAAGSGDAGDARHALVQATFGGRPGHPVFLGRAHWAGLVAQLSGDSGAKRYLAAHGATGVECSDLEPGDDVDSPVDAGQRGGSSSARST